MTYVLLIIFAYLCGSIPFGKIVGKLYSTDIQKRGSGNIGFANTVRVLGWRAGLIVLHGDVIKGTIPVLIAKHYFGFDQTLLVALATILGHVFPIWLKFKGGKGVATGLGATLALSPLLGCLGIFTYLLAFYFFRKSAPASITAAWSLPVLCVALHPRYIAFYLLLAVLTIWTHRNNIKFMLAKA